MAVDKVKEKLQKGSTAVPMPVTAFIYVRSEGKIFKVDFETLHYAEASGNYVKVVTDDQTHTISMTFASFESLLPKTTFLRVHGSFIINKSKIRVIEGNRITIGTQEIPIGANYREQFFLELGIR